MLRFVPTLADEARAVSDAQTARGGGLGEHDLHGVGIKGDGVLQRVKPHRGRNLRRQLKGKPRAGRKRHRGTVSLRQRHQPEMIPYPRPCGADRCLPVFSGLSPRR